MSDNKQQGGNNRCDAISVQDLLDCEEVPVPAYLREDNNPDMGDEDLPISNYTSRIIHEQEKEKLWPRVWQVVCREEDIFEAGEHYIHDSVDDSILVVRQQGGGIKAFVNSCLHRGRALRTENGLVKALRCPFHGFTWELDGSFRGMPCEWDFEWRSIVGAALYLLILMATLDRCWSTSACYLSTMPATNLKTRTKAFMCKRLFPVTGR